MGNRDHAIDRKELENWYHDSGGSCMSGFFAKKELIHSMAANLVLRQPGLLHIIESIILYSSYDTLLEFALISRVFASLILHNRHFIQRYINAYPPYIEYDQRRTDNRPGRSPLLPAQTGVFRGHYFDIPMWETVPSPFRIEMFLKLCSTEKLLPKIVPKGSKLRTSRNRRGKEKLETEDLIVIASYYGMRDVVGYLLQLVPPLIEDLKQGKYGWLGSRHRALRLAVKRNQWGVVRMLLDDSRMKDNEKVWGCVLGWALEYGQLGVAENVLLFADMYPDLQVNLKGPVRWLLSGPASVSNGCRWTRIYDSRRHLVLNDPILLSFLENNRDIGTPETLFTLAVQNNHVMPFKTLLKRFKIESLPTARWAKLLEIAAMNGYEEFLKLLLPVVEPWLLFSLGEDGHDAVLTTTNLHNRLLKLASRHGKVDVVKLLIQSDRIDTTGVGVAIRVASAKYNTEVVGILAQSRKTSDLAAKVAISLLSTNIRVAKGRESRPWEPRRVSHAVLSRMRFNRFYKSDMPNLSHITTVAGGHLEELLELNAKELKEPAVFLNALLVAMWLQREDLMARLLSPSVIGRAFKKPKFWTAEVADHVGARNNKLPILVVALSFALEELQGSFEVLRILWDCLLTWCSKDVLTKIATYFVRFTEHHQVNQEVVAFFETLV
ncbi:hypothetical protein BDR26DRAFT_347877 [Obelidium mucronatum]|nr:hypothetical protein BDR26DRAFT_347877 [Obelidium mucronatum]